MSPTPLPFAELSHETMATQEAYERTLRERLPRVRERVAAAVRRSGREVGAARIVAVTKGHPEGAIEAALAAGLRDLGENRVEELRRKAPLFANRAGLRWHAIGHIQRRKAGAAARLASLIHSVDSLRLAERLSRFGEAERRRIPVLVQVNASGEATKGGFAVARDLHAALDEIARVTALDGMRVLGLMTMAPFVADETTLRRTFRLTREALGAAAAAGGFAGRELSMGMSNDYEIAIEEGSTMVRLGTTLLGRRPG